MTRGIGEAELVAALPDPIVALFVFVTLLGDAVVLLVSLSLLYWFDPESIPDGRRVALVVVALAVAGFGMVVASKAAFALPRPPYEPTTSVGIPIVEQIVASETAADGFGFPSGHAIASTLFYGGLALFARVWSARRRAAIAGTLILAVSASRVLIGVHYVADVVVGSALGVTLLAVVWVVARTADGEIRPDRAFAVAAVAAFVGLAIAVTTGHADEVTQASVAAGTAIGGVVGWVRYGVGAIAAPALGPLSALGALVVSGGLWAFAYAGASTVVVAVAASALGMFLILIAPLAVDRGRKKISG